MIAKRGFRDVYTTIPQNKEWLTINVCINVVGRKISLFYTFKGVRILGNYLEHVEPSACMAMQRETWMTIFLFKQRLHFFVASILGS